MEPHDRKSFRKNFILLLSSLTVCFISIEIGYRIIDPFPYIPWSEINLTEHGNLSQYDELLGWKGVPSSEEYFITANARAFLQHNRLGFRDIEPEQRSPNKPAIVFLGDSFTWGHEVNFDEMFVNIIRNKISMFEVFNLAHRGYGTDQSLLTFQKWSDNRPLKLVILMFSQNDISDNASNLRYRKYKPNFEIVGAKLVLKNIPVPQQKEWVEHSYAKRNPSLRQWVKYIVLQSHFLHDMYFRVKHLRNGVRKRKRDPEADQIPDLSLTKRILQELRIETMRHGGRLIVIAIPAKRQFIEGAEDSPYQKRVQEICEQLKIPFFDLAPAFKDILFRLYFKMGGHWNSYGHKVAAEAIYDYLEGKEQF